METLAPYFGQTHRTVNAAGSLSFHHSVHVHVPFRVDERQCGGCAVQYYSEECGTCTVARRADRLQADRRRIASHRGTLNRFYKYWNYRSRSCDGSPPHCPVGATAARYCLGGGGLTAIHANVFSNDVPIRPRMHQAAHVTSTWPKRNLLECCSIEEPVSLVTQGRLPHSSSIQYVLLGAVRK